MSKRIGETLIDKGLLTDKQLQKALKAQLIFGGHLGTCLIEIGLVGEQALGETLSEVCGVPYASVDILDNVSEDVLKVLPAEMAERYNAIPIKLEERKLHVAMIQPNDLQALDEIGFATGYRIEPWVSPEIRIVQALEWYYGVQRRTRYLAICRELDRKRSAERELAGRMSTPLWDDETQSIVSRPSPPAAKTPPPPPVKLKQAGDGHDDAVVYGKSWLETAGQFEGEDTTADTAASAEEPKAEQPSPKPEPAPETRSESETPPEPEPKPEPEAREERHDVPADEEPVSADEIANRLCGAENKEDAARAVLAFCGPRMARCLLFGVRSETAFPWDGTGIKLDAFQREELRFPVTEGWVFDVLKGREYYRGTPPKDADLSALYDSLGVEPPSEILVVPIHLNDRLVALLYGDAGTSGRIECETHEFRRLAFMLSLSLNVVIYKAKIRAA